MEMLTLAMRTGMLPPSLWAIGRPLWSETSMAYWVHDFGGVWYRIWVCSMYVQFRQVLVQDTSFSRIDTTAAKALDTLRGLQGIGSAAIIPASVSIFLAISSLTLTYGGNTPAWNSSQGIPSRTLTFHRVCDFLRRCPNRSDIFHCSW